MCTKPDNSAQRAVCRQHRAVNKTTAACRQQCAGNSNSVHGVARPLPRQHKVNCRRSKVKQPMIEEMHY
eukprot:958607-Pelagomonas_calceolata.AAC.2